MHPVLHQLHVGHLHEVEIRRSTAGARERHHAASALPHDPASGRGVEVAEPPRVSHVDHDGRQGAEAGIAVSRFQDAELVAPRRRPTRPRARQCSRPPTGWHPSRGADRQWRSARQSTRRRDQGESGSSPPSDRGHARSPGGEPLGHGDKPPRRRTPSVAQRSIPGPQPTSPPMPRGVANRRPPTRASSPRPKCLRPSPSRPCGGTLRGSSAQEGSRWHAGRNLSDWARRMSSGVLAQVCLLRSSRDLSVFVEPDPPGHDPAETTLVEAQIGCSSTKGPRCNYMSGSPPSV